MKRTNNYCPHDVTRVDQPDGSILLTSNTPIIEVANSTGEWVHRWAEQAGSRVFVAERSGAGWRSESYSATLQKLHAIASALLARGLSADTPILIMSGNSVNHALLSLAAQYVGIPTVPVAEQYSLVPAAQGRLKQVVELIQPKMAYVENAAQYEAALRLDFMTDIEIVSSISGAHPTTSFDALIKGDSSTDVSAAHGRVTPNTVAKILMTSGSTSAPKGVLTTHEMMCVNQAQLASVLPFLQDHPPRIVDWLPWNHVFGGSHNVNMMLANGGSLYIDGGKPAPGLFEQTVENQKLMSGTICFNVPVGFQMLLAALQDDAAMRQRFFENLDMIFYAGASLPQDVWDGFERMAMDIKGEVPLITSSWGLTETAPAALLQQEPIETSGIVGVPLPAITMKLVPQEDGRFDVRAKGPSVMKSYFKAPEKTAEAFDQEGYFITGDAMKFVDPSDMNKGLKFDGRISEDFKLLTGTRVLAANLRLDVLEVLAPLVSDVVVTGADKSEIGLIIFPNIATLSKHGYDLASEDGTLRDPKLLAKIKAILAVHAEGASSSTRVARALIVSEPASMPEGEMTAKGNLNFRKILTRRADMLTRLYADADASVITL